MQVLHPHHKLAYFRKLKWSSDWVDLAEALVCEEFERNYTAIFEDVEEGEDENDDEVSPKPKVSYFHLYLMFHVDNAILEEGEPF